MPGIPDHLVLQVFFVEVFSGGRDGVALGFASRNFAGNSYPSKGFGGLGCGFRILPLGLRFLAI